MTHFWSHDPRAALSVGADFDLATFDRAGTPGWTASKAEAEATMTERGELLSELQERLFAQGRSGGKRSVLVVVQGLDTAGKGGVTRHVLGMVDPQGVALRSFGVPTQEELSHHYLWRIKRALPRPGLIGVFDRSHYEDVLVVRVDELVEEAVWSKRYDEINRWEKALIDGGMVVLKFALMVSHQEQGRRLMERIDRPDKRWKYSAGDLATRAKWDDFQAAYGDVFRLTSTDHAPWYVLPADRKWYPRLAITEILTRTLIDMDLKWPKPRWRPDAQRRRLVTTMTAESLAASLADTEATLTKAIEESVDVNEEAAEIRTHDADEATRTTALEAVRARRAELVADMEQTLRHKRELLADLGGAPDPTSEVAGDAVATDVEPSVPAQATAQCAVKDKPAKSKSKDKDKDKPAPAGKAKGKKAKSQAKGKKAK